MVTSVNINQKLAEQADRQSRVHARESPLYPVIGETFTQHETVDHGSKESARANATTNTGDGFLASSSGHGRRLPSTAPSTISNATWTNSAPAAPTASS